MAIRLLDTKAVLSIERIYGKDVLLKEKRWYRCLCGYKIKGTISSSGPLAVIVPSGETYCKDML